MQPAEERWQQLVEDVGLANATRMFMVEHPGQGDSVKDLAGIWEGMSVSELYEAIMAERASHPVAPHWTHLWDETRAGANASDSYVPVPVERREFVTCNCP